MADATPPLSPAQHVVEPAQQDADQAETASVDNDDAGIDLAKIDTDLDGVDLALRRLDDGTYWTDEVTGESLSDELLIADPTARRN